MFSHVRAVDKEKAAVDDKLHGVSAQVAGSRVLYCRQLCGGLMNGEK